MSADVRSLVEFLIARLDEEEKEIYNVRRSLRSTGVASKVRLLREVESRRRVVRRLAKADDEASVSPDDTRIDPVLLEGMLRDLAHAYLDHPEYRREWRRRTRWL